MLEAYNGTMAATRPEARLLLCCARISAEPERTARIRALLQEELDWTYLLQMALPHGMMPLLYWHLSATAPEAVPKSILDQLRGRFQENARRSLQLTAELLGLLNQFEAHGIPAVPYKGPTLAASVYGNLALRQFADLDILVHEQDVSRAKELLSSLGYRPEHQLDRLEEAAFQRSHFEHVFTQDNGQSMVELHWRITARHLSFPLDLEYLWRRLERIPLGGSTVLTFSPEDLLLILCMHQLKHHWERLSWICDVAQLIHVHERLDWEWVMEQATTLGSKRMLFLGLFLASDLLGASLPEKVWHRVQADPAVKVLARQVREQLFEERAGPLEIFAQSQFSPFRLRARERLRDKIRYCAHLVAIPTTVDRELLPLPGSLSPLYYVIRPVRLFGKYGWRLLRRLT